MTCNRLLKQHEYGPRIGHYSKQMPIVTHTNSDLNSTYNGNVKCFNIAFSKTQF